ncbi:uncharacterized protein si:ch211-195m9.3 isoform X2 [Channa argus]|uniref:uncharacterized protein si:ch211-195m9.3 isoform X2 n=1 Tax=Channa argus TaxID=215402 RepID=UPI003520B8E3
MSPLYSLTLFWMAFGFTSVYESAMRANAVSQHHCHYRNSNSTVYYDLNEAVCCKNKIHLGAGLSCCGNETFNPSAATCCKANKGGRLTEHVHQGISEKVSACCDANAYDTLNEMCCNSTIVAKPVPKAECCGNKAIDADKQLCCGPNSNKIILNKKTSNSVCCLHKQFDKRTQCCTVVEGEPQPQPLNSSECKKEHDEQHQKPEAEIVQQEQHVPVKCLFLKRNPTKPRMHSGSGQCDNTPTVFDTSSHICCDGCVSLRKPWEDQCCGQTPFGLAQRGVLCCNNTLFTDREDGEQCSENSIPYNPAKETICYSQFYGSPGEHCCGTEKFQPGTEICCNGHRHTKGEHVHCCGVKAYNIKDPQMMCCSGMLHNLTSLGKHRDNAQCCGSILHNPQDICCSSEEEQLLYSAKRGFRCCGHHYYNSSLWSCCAGKLFPVSHPGHHESKRVKDSEFIFLSLVNLNETDLCQGVHIGTVESVSPHSIVFSSVLKIHGRNATVIALTSHYILKISDDCMSPKLIPRKTYFFDDVNVFTDFNHDTILQSLHFIYSKCYDS